MNPEHDFEGYMESMEHAKAQGEMLASHQLWKETTWQGKTVGLLQAIAKHFAPFFNAVADTLADDTSLGFRTFRMLLLVCIVSVTILAVYFLAHILQMLIGTEIVIEDEVVTIEEVRQSELVDEKRDESVTVENKVRRSARSKKSKKNM